MIKKPTLLIALTYLATISIFSLKSHTLLANSEPGFSAQLTPIYTHNDSSTWLNGSLGRYNAGEDDKNHNALIEAQFGYRQAIGERVLFTMHVQARDNSDSIQTDIAGISELKLQYLQPLTENQRLLFTAGQFFLPSSMENTEAFWDTPYTISFSSINSWIGEEVRPIGIDLDYSYKFSNGGRLKTAMTGFIGNDSMGAILAWRGWSYGRFRSHYNETLILPPLTSLETNGSFEEQQGDGSKPFGKDLDNRTGYALRLFWQSAKQWQLKALILNNRGDKNLYQGEYAWDTQFFLLGAKWQPTPELTILAEHMDGSTAMGIGSPVPVNIDFTSSYFLSSYLQGNWRYSLRYDQFNNEDNDQTADDINADDGKSYTFASFYEPAGKPWKIGAELLFIDSERSRLTTNGLFTDGESSQFSLILHYKL